jgi:Flp pilus assembly pilin Flp
MRWVSPRRPARARGAPLARFRRDERGAVAILVAVLLGGGVLLGMGALVIDVGQLYQERAELQNGADAAALAVAESCAAGPCTPSIAASYADSNSSHGLEASQVCGSGSLGACPASTGKLNDCPQSPSGDYVDVRTSTKTKTGTVLPPVFAQTLAGNGSYRGTTVYACAQARWGGPSSASTVGFTISACDWDQATALGTVYAPPPPYPPNALPSPSLDRVLTLHSTTGHGCSGEPAGADGPGIFGWTADQTGSCGISVTSGTYGASPGVSASQSCKTLLSSAQASRTLLYLPVYTTLVGNGANGTFTLKGFAAFVVTGYHLPGFYAGDWLNSNNNCSHSSKCINGYFTQGLIPAGGPPGGTNLGLSVVQLSG